MSEVPGNHLLVGIASLTGIDRLNLFERFLEVRMSDAHIDGREPGLFVPPIRHRLDRLDRFPLVLSLHMSRVANAARFDLFVQRRTEEQQPDDAADSECRRSRRGNQNPSRQLLVGRDLAT